MQEIIIYFYRFVYHNIIYFNFFLLQHYTDHQITDDEGKEGDGGGEGRVHGGGPSRHHDDTD